MVKTIRSAEVSHATERTLSASVRPPSADRKGLEDLLVIRGQDAGMHATRRSVPRSVKDIYTLPS